jgi:hypothetical protein
MVELAHSQIARLTAVNSGKPGRSGTRGVGEAAPRMHYAEGTEALRQGGYDDHAS